MRDSFPAARRELAGPARSGVASAGASGARAARIADPRRWHESVEDADAFVYSALQIALRELVAGQTLDELLAARGELSDQLRDRTASEAAAVGIAVESVALRDVMVPPELRRAAAEVAMARAQGQAALERARSEVAAARALSNAAKMLADQPGLLQLRTLQAVESGGATVVLTTGPAAPVLGTTAPARS